MTPQQIPSRVNYGKLFFGLAVFTGAVIGFGFLIKQIKIKKALRDMPDLRNLSDDSRGNQQGLNPATEGDYSQEASEMYELLDGIDWFIQDKEDDVLEKLARMDCATRQGMAREFEMRYGNGDSFDKWLADDLGDNNLETARILMRCSSNFAGELDEDGFEIGAETSQPIIVSATNTGTSPMPITIG
tara:strand:+ start:1963 stop:2523 length:561 start_codon:yes stop_codon:yes gene_type:complete